ncbi:hypothetical protein [Caldithrix abyssi]|uniref:hypothetical protein n=1 Tax=Caldithrix abyssi TaxID=187145 RepID=UPI0012379E5B|nr:hypothetical protein [Caldithrix abyssi]
MSERLLKIDRKKDYPRESAKSLFIKEIFLFKSSAAATRAESFSCSLSQSSQKNYFKQPEKLQRAQRIFYIKLPLLARSSLPDKRSGMTVLVRAKDF